MNEYRWYDGEIIYTHNADNPQNPPVKQKRRCSPWFVSLIITLPICILTIIGCALLTFGTRVTQNQMTSPGTAQGGITVSPVPIDGAKAQAALSSVVNIQNVGEYGGFFGQSVSLGDGTGVIVREDGYILTSAYVVENIGKITVKLQDGTQYDAEVYNVDSANNAAILKIDAQGLVPIALGDSSKASVGDPVTVIGNTINEYLSNPVTSGIISGVNNGVQLQGGQKVNLFQIDASAIAESVGGLVLNQNGELIGIATAMISNPSSEIGIATPINDLKAVLNNIVNVEGSEGAGLSIGISGTDASYGVVIDMIGEGSAAEKAGLKVGDLVVKVDGEAVSSINDITNIKNRHKKGDTMVFSIYREGEMKDINVVLE